MNPTDPPKTGNRHRLLVVDDHPIVRRGLALLLNQEPDLIVTGEAVGPPQALAELHSKPFDLAIIDISLPGVTGIDLLKDIKIHWPRLPAIMFSIHDEMIYAERALRAGARGYLMKRESAEKIVVAIRQVLSGKVYVSEAVNTRILSRLTDGGSALLGSPLIDTLSNRELEVFQLIGRGRGTREIAHEMHVGIKTVETYRAHIKNKLHLKSAPELMRYAVDWLNQQSLQ